MERDDNRPRLAGRNRLPSGPMARRNRGLRASKHWLTHFRRHSCVSGFRFGRHSLALLADQLALRSFLSLSIRHVRTAHRWPPS